MGSFYFGNKYFIYLIYQSKDPTRFTRPNLNRLIKELLDFWSCSAIEILNDMNLKPFYFCLYKQFKLLVKKICDHNLLNNGI